MKRILRLFLAGATLLAAPLVQAWTYQDGDVLLIFRQTGSDDVEFDIGNISQFLNQPTGASNIVSGWDPSLVTNTFGTFNGVDVILAATSSSSSWISSSSNVTSVSDLSPSTWHSQLYSIIDAIGARPTNYNESGTESNAYIIQELGDTHAGESSLASYDYIVSGGGANESYIAQLGGNVTFTVQGAAPTTLGFWQIQPTNANPKPEAAYAGTFSIDGNGQLSFVAGPYVPPQAPQIQVLNNGQAIPNGEATPINFGSVVLNATGPLETFTVTNAGNVNLNLTNITLPAGFVLNGSFPATIPPGSNGTFNVQLVTSDVGVYSGNIEITNNDPTTVNDTFSFAVTGTVITPLAQIAVFDGVNQLAAGQTTPVNFGSVQQGLVGPSVTFTITNTGGQTLYLTNILVPTGFKLGLNYPTNIVAGSNATFSVQLNTSTVGIFAGNVAITNNDVTLTNSTFTFAVTGTVTPPAPQIEIFNGAIAVTNKQAAAINFGSVPLGGTGPALSFTVSNTGAEILTVSNITVPPGYVLDTNYQTAIAPGSNTVFTVQLNSSNAGAHSGNISVVNDDPVNNPFVFPTTGFVSSKIISLNGNLSFGVTTIGLPAQQVLTISNIGNSTLTISNISYPSGFLGNWPGGTIAAGSAQPVTVTFTPTVATNYGRAITVSSDANAGTNSIAVSGYGANSGLTVTVLINGVGTVTPSVSGKIFKAGTRISLKAVAGSAEVFSGWVGSINSTSNPLSFVIQNSTTLQANFVSNPFLPFVGTYNGLFSATNGIVTPTTAGLLKGLTINSKGAYSGSILIGGATKSLTGTFDATGHANKIISVGGETGTVQLLLTLTSNTPAPQVTGTVSGNGWESTNLLADQAASTSLSPAYTLLIQPDTNNPTIGGDGYALIAISSGTEKLPATAKITGALADGMAFSESTTVSQDGYAPVFASLYGGKGLLLGWINLDATNLSDVALSWVHSAVNHSSLFTRTFTSTNEVVLSPWSNNAGILGALTNLVLSDGPAGANVVTNVAIAISSSGKISGHGVSGTIASKTGLLTVAIGSGASKVTGHGVVLLNATNAGGYYVAQTNAGAVILNP